MEVCVRIASEPQIIIEKNKKSMPKRKHVKKNKIVPCTDANQHVRERAALQQKKINYAINRMAKIEAQRRLLMEQAQAMRSKTVDGLKKEE